MQFLKLRSAPSGPALTGTSQDDVPLWDVATQSWTTGPAPGGGLVDSVFGRVGNVVAVTGDYDSDQVDNLSSVSGASVSDALDWLLMNAGAVDSVFGRVGAVVAAAGDYDSDEVDNVSTVAGASVSDAVDALAGPVVPKSGAAMTLALSDDLAFVRCSHGSACTLEVPLNATVAFRVGALIVVEQTGAGSLSLVPEGAVVLNYPPSLSLIFDEQFQQVALKKVGADEWSVVGGLA